MCLVHLVPDVDELRTSDVPVQCGECEDDIPPGEPFRYIEGALDDDSTERWRYIAHDDCYSFSTSDSDDNDGCFVYGGARPV